MTRRTTGTEEELERRIAAHGEGTVRGEVIKKARVFKSSWVDLAQVLVQVRKEDLFQEWGYESFAQYCLKELFIRKATADKLTASYGYLRRNAAEVLDRDGVQNPIPSFQSISYLARAEDASEAPPETLAELRREVLEKNASLAAVGKKFGKIVFPSGAPAEDDQRSRQNLRIISAARRLAEILADSRLVPSELAADVEEQLGRLIAFVQNVMERKAKAKTSPPRKSEHQGRPAEAPPLPQDPSSKTAQREPKSKRRLVE